MHDCTIFKFPITVLDLVRNGTELLKFKFVILCKPAMIQIDFKLHTSQEILQKKHKVVRSLFCKYLSRLFLEEKASRFSPRSHFSTIQRSAL